MSEFNLSKKWREMGITESEPMFLRKDVKEFIRLLKKSFHIGVAYFENNIEKHIDEIAGKELV